MRSRSLARVFIAGLGVSVLITLGCSEPPTWPTKATLLSSLSISPREGSSAGGTVVRIGGMAFQSGTTVTVDGSRVDATVLDANTISFVMPAHAAGKVDVSVTRPSGPGPFSVPGGFTFFGPPVISELISNIGSTAGGTPLLIRGAGFRWGLTVTIGGIVTPVDEFDSDEYLYLSTPAHAAGTVEVIVTNPDGRAASATFTYASPDSFDFNGDWQGWAADLEGSKFAYLWLKIQDNVVVRVSCGQRNDGADATILTLDPQPVVTNGEFSFAGSAGVSITGKIVSPKNASGSMNIPACVGKGQWRVERK